ncbi:hypothetical protein IK3_03105 [Bacillus toyonensis]|uniref:hypothetical protein n=1 Tax=Bacillus TaxID=1386 RepID=UPI000279E11B|nr:MULTISPECIES: hypothetical protein [Bacillus]EJR62785.1 hypothetical protein IK3_03105 [Bacillus toyonensis]MDF9890640.1 hypothetical protein [Bacillus sp. LEw-kw-24]MDH6559301.1 hypothetical protein [Bacillus sp. LEw-kw-2]
MGKKKRYLKRENKKKQNRDVLGKKSEIEQFKSTREIVERFNKQLEPTREIVERLNKQLEPTREIWGRINEQIEPIMQAMQKRIKEQYQPILEQINKYKNIDWDALNQDAVEELKRIDRVLFDHEKEYWCLDMEIATSLVNGNIKEENLSEYVEKNLEAYVAEIIRNPMYEIHVTLIEEAYEAYKLGLYKLCMMPLFAAFEHVITFWIKGNITKEMISIKSNPKIKRLYKKIKPEEYRELEIEKINSVFVASVLRTFHNTFINGSDELETNLNRNSIAHGFHDYNTLSKVDALKLFQLLKSALILQFVSPKKVAE